MDIVIKHNINLGLGHLTDAIEKFFIEKGVDGNESIEITPSLVEDLAIYLYDYIEKLEL